MPFLRLGKAPEMEPHGYRIESNAPGSFFNSAAFDPGKTITFKTNLVSDGVAIDIYIPLKELMVPPHTLIRQMEDSAGESKIISGSITYYGWNLALPGATFGSYAQEGNYKSSPIRGAIRFPGLPDLPYYWAQPDIPKQPNVDFEDLMAESWSRRYQEWYMPGYRDMRIKLARAEAYGDVFNDAWRMPKKGAAGGPVKPVWAYMPTAVQNALHEYYEVQDPTVLLDQGMYPETEEGIALASSDVLERAKLRGSWPEDSAIGNWTLWVQRKALERMSTTIAAHTPDAAYLGRVIARDPQVGGFVFDSRVFYDVMTKGEAMYGRSSFADALQKAMFEVENVELRCFNAMYFAYLAEGMAPFRIINRSIEYYNYRQKKAAENAAKQGRVMAVLGIALMAIPTVGLGFSTALNVANAKSNYDVAVARAKREEETAKAVKQEVAETQDVIETVVPVWTEEKDREKDKKTGTIIAAVTAAGAGLIIAGKHLLK